jgi:hypothetical protein
MFVLWILLGMVLGPVALIAVLWFLRDVLPPTIFTPSDW